MISSPLFDRLSTLRTNRSAGSALFGAATRALSPAEVDELVRLGNLCADWSRVRVVPEFKPMGLAFTRLSGRVVLGDF